MQQRPGPNRVGPFGMVQGLADGVKLVLKEDLIPALADQPLYILAPLVATDPGVPVLRGHPVRAGRVDLRSRTPLQLTDLPVAVLFILAMAAIGVYGIVLAGWSCSRPTRCSAGCGRRPRSSPTRSRWASRWPRSSSTPGRCRRARSSSAQAKLWYALPLIPSFVIYLIAMVGETNRAPFDLPEAESELVAGFHTEYSSIKFAMFFLAEYINMTTVSALATTLFLGGWRAPWPLSAVDDGANTGWWPMIWFLGKLSSCSSSSSGCGARSRGCATTSSWLSAGRSSSRPASSGC